MEKTLDPDTGTVHQLNKGKKDALGIFYLCACGESTGLIWEKIAQDTPLNCLICMMHDTKNKPLNKRCKRSV